MLLASLTAKTWRRFLITTFMLIMMVAANSVSAASVVLLPFYTSTEHFAPAVQKNKQIKFAVNIRNGAIRHQDAGSFVTHDVLAGMAGANIEKDGFLWGIAESINGDIKIAVLTADIRNPLVRREWETRKALEFIKNTLAKLPQFEDFHGARIMINSGEVGHFTHAARLSTPAPTGTTPSSGNTANISFSDPETQKLYELIRDVDIKKIDPDFLKQVYSTPDGAKKLKEILRMVTQALFQEKSQRLAELRKFVTWLALGEYSRDHNGVTIEITNAGKNNGGLSDLDITGNLVEVDPATGKMVLKGGVAKLIADVNQRLTSDGKKMDVTLQNGDLWLPDWRDSRMSYDEYRREMFRNVYDLKNSKETVFVPGANREQVQDRPMAEGRSGHISWDYLSNRPMFNGRPFAFDLEKNVIVDAETKEPIKEPTTRGMAALGGVARYQGVEVIHPSDAWRRSLGNIVQNTRDFLNLEATSKGAPVDRNKYFIERIIDQGIGRFHNT